MTKFVSNKEVITKAVLELISANNKTVDLKTALISWWKNIRSVGGLGLSDAGSKAFELANLEYWEFDCTSIKGITRAAWFSLKLDQSLLCPYYLYYSKTNIYLRVYDSRIAIMINLHGNVLNYLKSTESRKK